jgi:hypothetical protein
MIMLFSAFQISMFGEYKKALYIRYREFEIMGRGERSYPSCPKPLLGVFLYRLAEFRAAYDGSIKAIPSSGFFFRRK